MVSMRKLWTSVLLLSIVFIVPTAYAVPATNPTTFWGTLEYSTCATTNCLVPITTSFPCEVTDNSCVCTTASFVAQVAACLGQKCPTNVATVYNTYKSNCAARGGFNFALTKTQFITDSGTLSSYLSTSFWASYSDCPRNDCLVPLTLASGCEIDDNSCVCSNTTLITQIAACVGKSCASSYTSSVYSLYSSNCASNGGYGIAVSEAQWDSAAGQGTPTGSGAEPSISTGPTTSATQAASSISSQGPTTADPTTSASTTSAAPTSVSTSTESVSTTSATPPTTSTDSAATPTASSGGGFTEDQKIAIGVGLGVGLPPIIIGVITLWVKCRGRLNP